MAKKTVATTTGEELLKSTFDIRDRIAQEQTGNGRKVVKTYEDGVDDGIRATLGEVVEYLDKYIATHSSGGYINVLKKMREEFINANF